MTDRGRGIGARCHGTEESEDVPRKKHWKRSILAAVGVGLLFGAATAGATGVFEEGSGNLVTERLDLSGFTEIEVRALPTGTTSLFFC